MAILGGTSASGETLTGTGGDDVIFNGVVNDRTTDGGVDTIDGGGGADIAVLVYTAQSANININISDPSAPVVSLGTLIGIEGLHFYGGSGNDTVTAGSGPDQLYGGAGNDTLVGAADNDTLAGGAGDDILDGGTGDDTADFRNATGPIGVDLRVVGPQNTGEGNDTFIGIENLLGSRFDDNLNGDAGNNTIQDTLFGDDILRGGDGADLIRVKRDYSVSIASSNVVLDGGAGNDWLEFNGDPNYFGSEAAGARYFDLAVFDAGDGDDQIFIHALGSAVILAGAGDDTVTMDVSSLPGGYRDVTLGAGADVLKISAPSDPSLAPASIVVRDFVAGDVNSLVNPGDALYLRDYLNAWLTGTYVDNSDPFVGGYLRLQQNGADTLVQIDRDGGGNSYSTFITLQNVAANQLVAGNFNGFSGFIIPGVTRDGTSAADTLTGTDNADTLNGLDGNDRLTGSLSSDTLNGGAGYDTAVYAGARRSYNIAVGGAAVSGGPEGGIDTLTGVERLQFVDGYFSTEAGQTDTAASVYRLYQTMLNRTPDSNGLAFWTQQIDFKGSSLKAVANGFIGSPEFNNTYGALNNDQFVELMYTNVLHRPSDAQGKANWVGLLNGGGARADVVLGFSQSTEFVNNMAPAIQKGVWVGDPNAGIAARFYDTVFSRLPDASGLDTWTKALNAGASLNTVANGFVASTEFQTTYGSLNNNQFVELMYNNVLHRPSDSGRQTWLDLLNNGGTRAQVVVGFSESPEHIKLLAPHIDDGVWVV